MLLHFVLARNSLPQNVGASSSSSSSPSWRNRVALLAPFLTAQPFHVSPYIRTSVALYLYSYTQVCTVLLAYLNCIDAGQGAVVFTQPTIHCDTALYKGWRVFVILLLICHSFLTPLFLITCLWYKRAYIEAALMLSEMGKLKPTEAAITSNTAHTKPSPTSNTKTMADLIADSAPVVVLSGPSSLEDKRSSSTMSSSSSSSSSEGDKQHKPSALRVSAAASALGEYEVRMFHRRWGVLYECYHPVSGIYFGSFILLRRLVCAILTTFIVSSLQWKMMGFLVLHFVCLQLELVIRPFSVDTDNDGEFFALAILVVLASFLTASPPVSLTYPVWLQVVISLLIFVPAAVLVGGMGVLQLRRLREDKRKKDIQAIENGGVVTASAGGGAGGGGAEQKVTSAESEEFERSSGDGDGGAASAEWGRSRRVSASTARQVHDDTRTLVVHSNTNVEMMSLNKVQLLQPPSINVDNSSSRSSSSFNNASGKSNTSENAAMVVMSIEETETTATSCTTSTTSQPQ